MSALGQKLPRDPTRGAAALPPKAAATLADRRVRFGPLSDLCNAANSILFEYFVGADENALRNGETERFGGLQNLSPARIWSAAQPGCRRASLRAEFCPRTRRSVGIDPKSRVHRTCTSALDIGAGVEGCRQPRAERKRGNLIAIDGKDRIGHDVKCVGLGREPLEGGPNILRPPDFERRDFEAELAGRGVNLTCLWRSLGICQYSSVLPIAASSGRSRATVRDACRRDRCFATIIQ